MAQLELVSNHRICWYCEVSPATTTRKSLTTDTVQPICADCQNVALALEQEVCKPPINLSELCIDILLTPYKGRA